MDANSTREAGDAWHMTERLHAETGKGDPFAAAVRATRMSMIITDPRQPDNPIVFANDAFLKLTGYARDEVMGRNCRFLQGDATDPETVRLIRNAVRDRTDIAVDVLNYTKDGRPFWNALYMSPVSNEDGEMQFFFASQVDVTDRKMSETKLATEKERFERAVRERTAELNEALEARTMLIHEVDHRVKNNLQMVTSLIVMQARTISDPEVKRSLTEMLERIEAVSTVHRRLYQSDDVTRFSMSELVRDLVTDLLTATGREEIVAEFDVDDVVVPADKATPIALMLNELITNALKHAFKGRDGVAPMIRATLRDTGDGFTVEISDNGHGMNEISDAGAPRTFGMRLVESLAKQLRARIDWSNADPGTRVVIQVPDMNPDSGENARG